MSSPETGLYPARHSRGPVGIRRIRNYSDKVTTGIITADLSGADEGWFRIRIGSLDQWITTVARPRHFGGRQWLFMCPYLNQRCHVLWIPPRADSFSCRQRWGRSVAYSSQFSDRIGRAHRGKAKINARLCQNGGFDPPRLVSVEFCFRTIVRPPPHSH
jgi:hypothetical protein